MDQGLQDCYCKNKERNGSQRLDQTRGSGFEGQISGSPGKLKKALEKRPCAATFGKKVPSSLCNKGASSLWKKGKKVSQEIVPQNLDMMQPLEKRQEPAV